MPFPRQPLPPLTSLLPPWQGGALVILCALYLLTGLIGHDPWKNDDATHFGIAWELLQSGGSGLPQLNGQPWLDTPPLYYWIAAATGKLFGYLLPLHDAIRLTSGLCGALYLVLLGCAARWLAACRPRTPLEPPENTRLHGHAAILIALGCLGLLVPIHDTQPLIALLAAQATAYAGLARIPQRPLAGSLIAAGGLGLGLLAGGILAALHLLPLWLLLPCNTHWRTRAGLSALFGALFLGLLPAALWLTWLYTQHPIVWQDWLARNLAMLPLSGTHTHGLHALPIIGQLLSWFAWPALPLALWALWLNRHRLNDAAIALPAFGVLTSLTPLLLFAEARPLDALPLLPPLVLLAASSAHLLRRGAGNALDWFGMMTFSLIAGLIWLADIALTTGLPTRLAQNIAKLQPGFPGEFLLLPHVIAALMTLAWFWLIFASPRSPTRAISHWAAGLMMIWTLTITLILPWIDYGKSYRSVATALHTALPSRTACIAGRNLGYAQQVSFKYFAGIVTLPQSSPQTHDCPLLLEQVSGRKAPRPLAGWNLIWEGHRPGDRNERIRLYQRPGKLQP
jgi:4-amino-4-deoxy-L-arabinose transferase-like glycosyltransferase